MSPLFSGLITLACVLGGVAVGMWYAKRAPEHHLTKQSTDSVKVSMGLTATMTALVLGLVTASSKSSYDAEESAVKQSAVLLLTLDRALARYGPETHEIRDSLRSMVRQRYERVWSSAPHGAFTTTRSTTGGEAIEGRIEALTPQTDAQRRLQSKAIDISDELLQARWVVSAGATSSVPKPFLIILVGWLTILFMSFGLFAPRNATVVSALFLCALSVSSAIFLILELNQPFAGLLRLSAEPIRFALTQLGQ
ncbi:MAG TPA: hypothetical protein VEI06_17115 [Gemmatimonadaceae bacterium]|nr:hypothetical protein [Gemmatimonadaceae bacterium]